MISPTFISLAMLFAASTFAAPLSERDALALDLSYGRENYHTSVSYAGLQLAPTPARGGSSPSGCPHEGSGIIAAGELQISGLVAGLCLEVGYDYPGCEQWKSRGNGLKATSQGYPTHTTQATHQTTPHTTPRITSRSTTHTITYKTPSTRSQAPSYTPPPKSTKDRACDPPLKYNAVLNACVDIGHGCEDGKQYSSLVSACVGLELFVPPFEGKCGTNTLDNILGLCLDLNAYYNQHSTTSSARPASTGRTGSLSVSADVRQNNDNKHGCSQKQRYSQIYGTCLDAGYFAPPSNDGACKVGWKYDSYTKLCLDLSISVDLSLPGSYHTSSSNGNNPNNPKPKPKPKPSQTSGTERASSIDVKASSQCSDKSQKWSALYKGCIDSSTVKGTNDKGQCDYPLTYDVALNACLAYSHYSTHLCTSGQLYSLVAEACVGLDYLKQPHSDKSCPEGCTYDSLLSLCLDLSFATTASLGSTHVSCKAGEHWDGQTCTKFQLGSHSTRKVHDPACKGDICADDDVGASSLSTSERTSIDLA